MKPDPPAPATAAPAAAPADDDRLWYKDAVIYELHIKAFCDADGDGIGDFEGLIGKLDYLRDLGINTLWLLPFYPSPFRDDGYDVADFTGVHPAYGTVADVSRLVAQAHERGLRVITELVLNHTSDQHPWFQAARRAAPGTPERDFYVWSDDPQRYAGTRIIFTDSETSNWTWDEVAGQYYWHRFFSHQPDLNYDHPAVREAVFGVMDFWLAQGVDGFRLDAVPYLVEREGTSNENLRETHEVIKELRRRLDAKYPGKLLLAEANMWPEDVREYFGDDDECHMAYHFPLMPRMYMAIAQEDRHPVVEILAQTPEISPACQWAVFLRNHDELTLEMVTDKERDYMVSMYAADPRARLNLGIRRRLAPLLGNDRARIELMNSLLLSMPGSPVLYYGDEIGMGDNIFLGDRDGVRTPMQWNADRNGGFSRADPQRLYLPTIQDAVYGFEAVNVERQAREPSSLLNWTRRMLAVRRSTPVFGRGRITLLHPGNRKVLAYLRELGDEVVLCVANLGRSAQPVELDLARYKGRVPVEMAGRVAFPPVAGAPYLLTLPAHGHYWFRLATDVAAPAWHSQRAPAEDLAVLVLFDGWNSLFRDRVVPWRIAMATKTLAQFEAAILPRFFARQPGWFRPGSKAPRLRIVDDALLGSGERRWLLTLVSEDARPAARRWFVPLALAWEDEEARTRLLAPAALAKVRMQARVGLLADAAADEAWCRAVVQAIAAGLDLRSSHGTLRLQPTRALAAVAGAALPAGLRVLPNTRASVLALGERVLVKVRRRVQAGIDPEFEVGRFLTEVADFRHGAATLGRIEHVGADGATATLLLLQVWVPNQGSAWDAFVEQLARELELATPPEGEGEGEGEAADAGLLTRVRLLAQRTAAMHAALACRSGDPAFEPEPVGAADLQRWAAELRTQAAATLGQLQAAAARLPDAAQALAGRIAAAAGRIEAAAQRATARPPQGHKTRLHGGYRLQELLLTENDFVIIDFEGDPHHDLAARRAKDTPLRDIASLLRSFDQARRAALGLGTHAAADGNRREARAQAWGQAVRGTFLQAYDEAGAAVQPPLAAATGESGLAGLAVFETVLALRELGDELHHHPHAATASLASLAALLGA